MKLSLPWPPKELSPNARVHFLAKALVTKAYREQAFYLADSEAWDWSQLRCTDGVGPITLSFIFHPPDKRKRDLDTMLSSVKAGIDGIADALGVNDVRFEYILKRAEPVKSGRVDVEIS